MKRILLVGDRIIDDYRLCEASRLCPEAPIPVLSQITREERAGGAALVEANLRSLGLDVDPLYGSESTKVRYFVGNHLICRVDSDSYRVWPEHETATLAIELLNKADAVVVSDYCKGAIGFHLARLLVESGKPCFVDTKNNHIEWFRGDNVILFPNQREYEQHVRTKEHLFGLVVEKRGADGCYLHGAQYDRLHVPAQRRNVFDVTGAGDCFMAAFVYAWSRGADMIYSAKVANEAAGRSVEHTGTYIVKPSDIAEMEPALTAVTK